MPIWEQPRTSLPRLICIMPHLPVELYSLIIANLSPEKDSEALKSSALSFRQLTFPSHQQLFSHIIIRSPDQCCSSFHHFGGTSTSFRTLLDNSLHIAKMVRCLEIFDWPGWHIGRPCSQHKDFKIKRSWLRKDRNLRFCLLRLTKLEALTLNYRQNPLDLWSDIPKGLATALQDTIQLPSLIHIDMEGTTILPVLQRVGSQVKHLVLHERIPSELNMWSSTSRNKSPIFLESLFIEAGCDLSFDPLLLGIGSDGRGVSLLRLKKLHVYLEEELDQTLPLLVKILHEGRNSIEEFVLSPFIDGENCICITHLKRFKLTHLLVASLDAQDKFKYFSQPLNLSTLKMLKRFHVHLEFTRDDEDEGIHDSFPWFISILRRSDSDNLNLREIDIDLGLDYDEGIDDIATPLNTVADIILGSRFPKLCSMRFFVRTYQPTTEKALIHLESSPFAQRMRSIDGFTLTFEHGGRLSFILFIQWSSDEISGSKRMENFVHKSSWLRVASRDEDFPMDLSAYDYTKW